MVADPQSPKAGPGAPRGGRQLAADLLHSNGRDRDRLILGTDDPQNVRAAGYRKPTPEEVEARKRRSLAIGLALAGFCLLVFLVTLSRLHANVSAGGAGGMG